MTYFIGGGRRWKHTCAHTHCPTPSHHPVVWGLWGWCHQVVWEFLEVVTWHFQKNKKKITQMILKIISNVRWGIPRNTCHYCLIHRKAGYDVQEKNHPSADHRLSLPLPHTHWATKSAAGQGITTWWKIKMSDLICQILSVSPHTLADISPIWSVLIKSKETDWSDLAGGEEGSSSIIVITIIVSNNDNECWYVMMISIIVIIFIT